MARLPRRPPREPRKSAGPEGGRRKKWTPAGEPRADRTQRRDPERDHPLLRAFAHDADRQPVEVHVVHIQPGELGDADPCGVEQLDHGDIAEGAGVALARPRSRAAHRMPSICARVITLGRVLSAFGARSRAAASVTGTCSSSEPAPDAVVPPPRAGCGCPGVPALGTGVATDGARAAVAAGEPARSREPGAEPAR